MAVDPGALLQHVRTARDLDDAGPLARAIRRVYRLAAYGPFVLFGCFAVLGVWLFLTKDIAYVDDLLGGNWLPALFLIFILEGAMLLYFAPSESLVPIAIAVVGTSPHTIATILAVAVGGATIGQYALFRVAQRAGREAVVEHRLIRVSDRRLARFERWFDRWGVFAVPVSNSLPFTRGMVTIPAGLAEMSDRQFIIVSAIGTLVFESLLALVAFGVLSLPWVDVAVP